MKIVWVKSMVHPLAWIILLSGFMMQYETEAIRLYSSSMFGFVGHGVRINSFKPNHFIKTGVLLPRSDLCKVNTFNPVKSIFDTLLSVPKLIFKRRKQATEDNTTDDLLDFELDQEKQWRREERDELEHWHYWTSEQRKLREENEAKQKLQWPEVVARCVTEPLRRERQQHLEPATSPSPAATTSTTLNSNDIEEQKAESATRAVTVPAATEVRQTRKPKVNSAHKAPGRKSLQPWSSEEETLLVELVKNNTINPHLITKRKNPHLTRLYVNWLSVSQVLNRPVLQCKIKWRVLRDRSATWGRFSAQEDALIQERLEEWNNMFKNQTVSMHTGQQNEVNNRKVSKIMKKGLWAKLDRELNRREGSVLRHWQGRRTQEKQKQ